MFSLANAEINFYSPYLAPLHLICVRMRELESMLVSSEIGQIEIKDIILINFYFPSLFLRRISHSQSKNWNIRSSTGNVSGSFCNIDQFKQLVSNLIQMKIFVFTWNTNVWIIVKKCLNACLSCWMRGYSSRGT